MASLSKILIVDDEEELVSTLKERLDIRGYHVTGALCGEEALEAAAREDFDVVLLDVRLKGEDGIEVMRRLKEIRPSLPVLLLTGHASADSGEAGLKAGATDYLIKPIHITDLIRRMDRAVSSEEMMEEG